MNFADHTTTQTGFSESQKSALIKLLADEDEGTFRAIRGKLLSGGKATAEWLRPEMTSEDPVLRQRAREVVGYLDRQAADNRFLAFCLKEGEDLDLETGAWMLAQTEYPHISQEGYRAWLDLYAATLQERLRAWFPPHRKVAVVTDYLFAELGFCGNQEDYYDPRNSYLNAVLDRRTGNPISLCLVCILVARRLRLPVVGIGLPGHFLCRYQSSAAEFYIDAFNRGRLLTKADCIAYLQRSSYELRDDYLAPVTSRRLLLRMCRNLHSAYLHLGKEQHVARFQHYLVALGR